MKMKRYGVNVREIASKTQEKLWLFKFYENLPGMPLKLYMFLKRNAILHKIIELL